MIANFCRYEDDMKQHEDFLKRLQFRKEAKNLFSSPKGKDVGLQQCKDDSLTPPIRPTMKIIPSWQSVLCSLEARLEAEFRKLEKW
jgi:hypothetical protein